MGGLVANLPTDLALLVPEETRSLTKLRRASPVNPAACPSATPLEIIASCIGVLGIVLGSPKSSKILPGGGVAVSAVSSSITKPSSGTFGLVVPG